MKTKLYFTALIGLVIGMGQLRAQQMHTQANAVSLDNESNTLDGWTLGNALSSVETNEVFNGNYAIKFEAPHNGWYRGQYDFNAVVGQKYLIKITGKESVNGSAEINLKGTADNKYAHFSGNWETYMLPVTASETTIKIRIYSGIPSLQGDYAYIDAVSINPINGSDSQAPSPPTLSSNGHTDTAVGLTWTAASDNVGVIGYKVYKNGNYYVNTANLESYQMKKLEASRTYNFTVTAIDSQGNESAASNQVTVSTSSGPDSQNPTPPTLSSTAKTSTSINLNWSGATDNIGVTGYKIYKEGVLETSLASVTSYGVTGLSPNTTYTFTVRAVDAAGNESGNSNILSFTTNTSESGSGGGSVWTQQNTLASYSGEVAIGTNSVPSGYKMAVEGKIRTREIRVDQDTWPDYVFQEGYDLPTLEEIQKHIEEKGHLPNIPSAAEVEAHGVELGEMNRLLLEKVEELTLYLLDQERKNKIQQKEIENLKRQLE